MTVGTGISFADGIAETKTLTGATLVNPTISGTITLNGNVTMSGGALTNSSQPAFSAYVSVTLPNVTGDDTDYTVPFDTEIYDRTANYNPATGLFTAPVSGIYFFSAVLELQGLVSGHLGEIRLATSNAVFKGFSGGYYNMRNTSGDNLSIGLAQDAYMDAGDTASVVIDVFGGAGGKVVDLRGGTGPLFCYFTGRLAC